MGGTAPSETVDPNETPKDTSIPIQSDYRRMYADQDNPFRRV